MSRDLLSTLKTLALSYVMLGSGWITSACVPVAPDIDWPLRGRDHNEQHHSSLDLIRVDNIDRLGLSWSTDLPSPDGLIATPIVIDGTIYVSGSFARVFAIDAESGKHLWSFDPNVRRDGSITSAWSVRVNRGVAVNDGRVFVGTGDCRLIAIDAKTGLPLWDVFVCRTEDNYGITGAPRLGEGLVFIGANGSDHGGRGFAAAFRQETGEEVWRFFTVPGDPALPYESDALAMAAQTWTGEDSWKSGGGTVWEGITYDPDLGRVYLGVAGASPWDPTVRSPGGGDNLFLCSIVAVDARSGEYIWHYQTVPRDAWDFDASMPMMLAELEIDGETQPVLMQAPKNGFFYVLNRRDGKLLSAENYVRVSWAERIDLETGRPVEKKGARYHDNPSGEATVFPSIWGGHSWQAMSYNPETGLVYLPALNFPSVFKTERGALMGGIFVDLYGYDPHDPERPSDLGKLIAWDPVSQSERWHVDYPYPFNSGTLTTAGGLVFQGTTSGEFHAYRADSGDRLWTARLGSAVQAAPVTYTRGGKQFVLVAAGWGGSPRTMVPAYGAALDARGPSRLFAFTIGANEDLPDLTRYPTIVPEPPAPRPTSKQPVEHGAQLFEAMSCSMCHGQGAEGALGGSVPDLRYLSRAVYGNWFDIVLGGQRSALGMLSFEPHMSRSDAADLRAFVLNVAWDAHEASRPN